MGNENSSSNKVKSYKKDYSSSYSSNNHNLKYRADPPPKKPDNPKSKEPDIKPK